jgi:hypothetical protein
VPACASPTASTPSLNDIGTDDWNTIQATRL